MHFCWAIACSVPSLPRSLPQGEAKLSPTQVHGIRQAVPGVLRELDSALARLLAVTLEMSWRLGRRLTAVHSAEGHQNGWGLKDLSEEPEFSLDNYLSLQRWKLLHHFKGQLTFCRSMKFSLYRTCDFCANLYQINHNMPHNDPNSLPIYSHITINPNPSQEHRIKYYFNRNLFLNKNMRLWTCLKIFTITWEKESF